MKDFGVLFNKIKIGLGVFSNLSPNIDEQLKLHVKSALHFFCAVKGIDENTMLSDSGIQLLTIYVNDVWREGGKFEFSPATEAIFESLFDHSRGLKYADETGDKHIQNKK